MKATTIRIRAQSHQSLKEMSEMTGQTVQDELDQAIEERRRRLYLDGLNADYAAMSKSPKSTADFKKESAVWDATHLDGLEDA